MRLKVPLWTAPQCVTVCVCMWVCVRIAKGVALKPNSALWSPPTPLRENTSPFKLCWLVPKNKRTFFFLYLNLHSLRIKWQTQQATASLTALFCLSEAHVWPELWPKRMWLQHLDLLVQAESHSSNSWNQYYLCWWKCDILSYVTVCINCYYSALLLYKVWAFMHLGSPPVKPFNIMYRTG